MRQMSVVDLTIRVGRDRYSIVLIPRRINSAYGWRMASIPYSSALPRRRYPIILTFVVECCANCEAVIGNLETPFLWKETVVCEACYRRLSQRQHAVVMGVPMTPTPTSLQPPTPIKAKYNSANDTFTGTTTILVKLAMRAVQDLGWKLDNANESLGMVTFQTGMSWGSFSGVSCSLNIEEVSANEFRVTGTGKQNMRGAQLIAINLGGEAKSKARKAIVKMQELAR